MSSNRDDAASSSTAQPTSWGGPSVGDGPTPPGWQLPTSWQPPAGWQPAPDYGQPETTPSWDAPLPHGGYGPQPTWVAPVPVYPYTRWGRRVGAYLIDFAPAIIAAIPFFVGYVLLYLRLIELASSGFTAAPSLEAFGPGVWWMLTGLVLLLAAFGWLWYNRWLVAGRTGQSLGKRVLNTRLLAEVNGQPIGPVNAFLRDLLHILDGIAYLGYLWPLWDAKRQTFADKIMKTVVIDQPAPTALEPGEPS